MSDEERSRNEQMQVISMSDLMWKLPLFDNLFLSMQGQNIMLVDFHIRDLETDLLRTYMDRERTPIPETRFVSALSQMWIFAAYELLRTWRQFIRELKKEVGQPSPEEAADDGGPVNLAAMYWKGHVEEYRGSEEFRAAVEESWTRVEPVFRRIEALRMNLAKHEVPKRKGERAMAPGYGRIDGFDGSIYWMVDLGNNAVDIVSRRSLSEGLRLAVIGRSVDGYDEDREDDDNYTEVATDDRQNT
jgi:hypothetical protein